MMARGSIKSALYTVLASSALLAATPSLATTPIAIPGGGTLQSGPLHLTTVASNNKFFAFGDGRYVGGTHVVGNGYFSNWSSTPTNLSLAFHYNFQLCCHIAYSPGVDTFAVGSGTVQFFLTDLSHYTPSGIPVPANNTLAAIYAAYDAAINRDTAAVEAGTPFVTFDVLHGSNLFANSSQFGSSFYTSGGSTIRAISGIGAALFPNNASFSFGASKPSLYYYPNETPHDNAMLTANLAAVRLVGAVPEPATWALMLAGFGLVGVALRRRQAVRVSFV